MVVILNGGEVGPNKLGFEHSLTKVHKYSNFRVLYFLHKFATQTVVLTYPFLEIGYH